MEHQKQREVLKERARTRKEKATMTSKFNSFWEKSIAWDVYSDMVFSFACFSYYSMDDYYTDDYGYMYVLSLDPVAVRILRRLCFSNPCRTLLKI
jgi:hypothetical protein